jgi:hypothetical protein
MQRPRIARHSIARSKIYSYKHAHFQPAGQEIDKARYRTGGAAIKHEVSYVFSLALQTMASIFDKNQ